MEQQIQFSESYIKNQNKYKRVSHMVGVSMWEFEWCPKYRYHMFKKWKYRKLVEACIRRAASLHKIKWIELNVQPDHVQGTAEIPFTMSPSMALQYLKGISAKLFFEHHEKARLRYPKGHLWSRGRFAASLGFVQIEVVNEYVRNQDEHHGTVWIMEE
ncbi:MAG: IS200/IS605 family transposase [Nanoarchaeota archaeon]